MRKLLICMSWDLGEGEQLLLVRGEYAPAYAARLSGHPDTWAPADGGELYIHRIEMNGKRLDSKAEKELVDDEKFNEAVWERIGP